MITYAQFCPVAKAAEVFGDRWSPIIIRELCFGARSFGQLLEAAPPISRTMLAQRLKQLAGCGKSRDFGKMVMKRSRNGNPGLIKSTGYEGAEGDELGWKQHRPTFSAAC